MGHLAHMLALSREIIRCVHDIHPFRDGAPAGHEGPGAQPLQPAALRIARELLLRIEQPRIVIGHEQLRLRHLPKRFHRVSHDMASRVRAGGSGRPDNGATELRSNRTLSPEYRGHVANFVAFLTSARVGKACQFCYFLGKDLEMPTRNINLTPEQDAFVEELLEAGEYGNASEAMRDAVRALKQRRAEEALKLDKLRVAIKQGTAALKRGDYTDVEDEDLDARLDDLATGR